jgi:hypothetical protein
LTQQGIFWQKEVLSLSGLFRGNFLMNSLFCKTYLLAGADLARENTTESVETALVRGGHHLGDIHHQRCVGIAVLHANACLEAAKKLILEQFEFSRQNQNLFWGGTIVSSAREVPYDT